MPVYKQASGYYRIQFCLNGKDYVKSSKTDNKKKAEIMEADWRSEIHGRRYLGDLEEIKVQQLVDDYMKLPLAETTLKNARFAFQNMKEDMDFNVNASEFDQKYILAHVQKRIRAGIKESTLRCQLLCFSGAWNDGNREIYNIPELKLPKLKQSPVKLGTLTDQEEEQLFAHLDNRIQKGNSVEMFKDEIKDCFIVLIDTGMRYNELCKLEWSKIDLVKGKIEIWRNKTNVPSYIDMTNRLRQVLQRRSEYKLSTEAHHKERRRHAQWVFTDGTFTGHRKCNTSYINTVIKNAGLPYSVHQFRHTFASRLLKEGMTLFEMQSLLGHKNIQSTMRYSHLEKDVTSAKAVDIMNARHVEKNRAKLKAVS